MSDEYDPKLYMGFMERYVPAITIFVFLVLFTLIIATSEVVVELLGIYSTMVYVPMLMLGLAIMYGVISSVTSNKKPKRRVIM